MDSCDSATLPRFVIARPARLRGTVLVLAADRLLLGRGGNCDLRLEDAHVSLAHAELSCSAAQTMVRDLGSTNGTLVNGTRIATAQALRHGDVLRFGTVEARFEEPAATAAPTGAVPEVGSLDLEAGIAAALRAVPAGRHARLDTAVGADTPRSDPGGRPFDQYVHQIIVGQADRLRQVAATGSRARRLAAIGFVVFALGLGIITGLLVRPAAAQHSLPSTLGPAIYGIPIGVAGFGAALIGIAVMAAGIVPHLTATSARRLESRARPAAASLQDWPAVPPLPAGAEDPAEPRALPAPQIPAQPPAPPEPQPLPAPQIPAQPPAPPEPHVPGQPQVPGRSEPSAAARPALPRRRDPVREVLRRRVATAAEDAWSST